MALWLHFFGQCLDIIVCWPLCFGWTCVSPSSSVSLAKLAEGLLAQVFRAPRGMLCFVILLLTCEHNVMLGLRGLPSPQSWDFDKLCSVLSLTHSHLIITDIFPSFCHGVNMPAGHDDDDGDDDDDNVDDDPGVCHHLPMKVWHLLCPKTVAHNESCGK